MEAADEIARQLRLRDLAGLVVIDFIDMDEKRNNRTVERRMKEALKQDRARIQVGHISHFGLLEMSRQRIRSSVLESSTDKCPQCGGTGHVRSVSSVSLQLLRSIEEMLLKGATHNIIVRTRTEIALYLLNHKRAHLRTLEERFRIIITVNADATISGQVAYAVEKGELVHSLEQAKAIAAQPIAAVPITDDEDDFVEDEEAVEESDTEAEAAEAGETVETIDDDQPQEARGDRDGGEAGRGRRRRRRGRRGEGREGREGGIAPEAAPEHGTTPTDEEGGVLAAEGESAGEAGAEQDGEGGEAGERNGDARRRRRGRRGGRRNRRGRDGEAPRTASDSTGAFEGDQGAESSEHDPVHEDHTHQAPVERPETERHETERHETYATPQDNRAPEPASFEPPAFEPPTAPPPPAPVAAQPAPEPESTAPRRRSTVRERAPVLSSEAEAASPPPAPPQPVVTETANADTAEQPRRSGWWRKR
jgi:ribonuclease E